MRDRASYAFAVVSVAAATLLSGARPTHDNAFKITLVERTLAAVLLEARDDVREHRSKQA